MGLKTAEKNYTTELAKGFVAGFIILGSLILSLMLFDIYSLHSGRNITLDAVIILVIKAIITGLAVGVIEETLFRGAILTGLMKRSNAVIATITVSLVYAAAHFIDYHPQATDQLNWLSAPAMFLDAYSGIFNPEILDALIALFLLGILLSLVRLRTGNIIQCIGLHAGLVAAIKISRYFTQYDPDNRFSYLVSSHDHRLGWLAVFWLGLAIGIYYTFRIRGKADWSNAKRSPSVG